MPEKEVSQRLNKARNWLKHWDERADTETVCLELDKEPIQYIVRALANLATHDVSLPSEEGRRFLAWLSENGMCPDDI